MFIKTVTGSPEGDAQENTIVEKYETPAANEINTHHPVLKNNPSLQEGVRNDYYNIRKTVRFNGSTPLDRKKK
ncbi:MAG: hypothetical protein R3D00_16555 [Bacteroidia bacterium]